MDLTCHFQRSALWSLSVSGLPRYMARRHAGLGGILCFHRITQPGPAEFGSESISVTPTNFRRTAETLKARGYRFVSMSALVDRLRDPDPRPEKFVCLTFDDGFVDSYTEAFPICRAFGIPMTVYLVSSFVTREFPMWLFGLEAATAANDAIELAWEGERLQLCTRTLRQKRKACLDISRRFVTAPPEKTRQACTDLGRRYGIDFMALSNRQALTSAMIAKMKASGLVEFGAHTVHHAYLGLLGEEAARWEVAQGKRDCESIVGTTIRHFAYPYGDSQAAGAREAELCREAGFETAVTTESNTIFGSDRDRLLALPRLSYNGSFQNTPLLDLLLSGALPTLRRWWRVSPMRRALSYCRPTPRSGAASSGPGMLPGTRSREGRCSAAEP